MASGYDATTPYHFALNNPISLNDPTGLEADGWYLDGNKNMQHDTEINSQKDLDDKGIKGTYQGKEIYVTDEKTGTTVGLYGTDGIYHVVEQELAEIVLSPSEDDKEQLYLEDQEKSIPYGFLLMRDIMTAPFSAPRVLFWDGKDMFGKRREGIEFWLTPLDLGFGGGSAGRKTAGSIVKNGVGLLDDVAEIISEAKITVIGKMDDLNKYDLDDAVDTWRKSGRIPAPGELPIRWAENVKWLQDRIDRGDRFWIATNPYTLPNAIGGYIPGVPNGYFTARELYYLNNQGIKPLYKP